jgi:ribosomal protein L37E
MSSGLFAVVCPRCGREISTDDAGEQTCTSCGATYLSRFGHLIAQSATRSITPGAGVTRS